MSRRSPPPPPRARELGLSSTTTLVHVPVGTLGAAGPKCQGPHMGQPFRATDAKRPHYPSGPCQPMNCGLNLVDNSLSVLTRVHHDASATVGECVPLARMPTARGSPCREERQSRGSLALPLRRAPARCARRAGSRTRAP